ncbi:MAG: NAD(P)(+) transhydrogenase (Re/Si-specific) subunit beta [Pirellulaceae bacterium]|nr:NAD(P)(+) transhydrogenase (Re/Si-specific) subunit beta [Pirellulaceae bacterium]
MALVKLAYIIAAVFFIFGLKFMAHPRTAVRGNLFGAIGMGIAIIAAIVEVSQLPENHYGFIVAGCLLGTGLGIYLAATVQMTSMPQLVALFNALGGLASVFVAGGALALGSVETWDALLASGVSGLIGAVTFSGSMLAAGKLKELPVFRQPIPVPGRHVIALVVVALLILCLVLLTTREGYLWLYIPITLLSLGLGFLLVNPIGGADMPVVIALFNSYSGLAATATGFVIDNDVLIISGSLVGASGLILTQLMCKAMNRSLGNVLFGVMQAAGGAEDVDEIYANVRSTTADDVAMILDSAQRVVVVPGYGLAVAQAQHAVRDLGKLLEAADVSVEYGIHPVAGRMPGHMNVLLAEADIDYDKLKEMDQINPTMETVDVAIVIGANDVVNPVAQTDPDSPIAGMPIIEVGKARTVIVIKRSLSPGFAGIANPLFAAENTLMLFGDGQEAVLAIVSAIKEN